MSNLIKLNGDAAGIFENEWTCVNLPASQAEQRVQAGKECCISSQAKNLSQTNKSQRQSFPQLVK